MPVPAQGFIRNIFCYTMEVKTNAKIFQRRYNMSNNINAGTEDEISMGIARAVRFPIHKGVQTSIKE